MKRAIAIFLVSFGIGLVYSFAAKPAECTWCPTFRCYGPCGINCVCLSDPGEISGRCYGVNTKDALLASGKVEVK